MNPSAMKGSELKGRVRGLCWGLSECLRQTLDGNEGLRPRERAGRAARKAAGDRQLGFSQVLRWAFSFLDVTPILFFFFLNIGQYCTSSQRRRGWDLWPAHLRLDLSEISVAGKVEGDGRYQLVRL